MGRRGSTTIEVGADGVALITIVNPPVNALSSDVILGLKENYEEALRRDDVKAIVLTGAGGRFSGGADINAFGKKQKENWEEPETGYVSINIVSGTIEGARKPSVAAIDGLALGGGLEIAMACHARISTSTSQIGLPELQLGIIPGLGGTQRLPRLIGLSKALDMILLSKSVKGEEACDLGLVDAVAPPNALVKTARLWALDVAEYRRPWVKSLYRTDKLEELGAARQKLKLARIQIQNRSPNLKHPLECIDVIEEGIVSGVRAGVLKEAKTSKALQFSDTSKSLIHFFFAQRAAAKVPGVTNLGSVPRRITKVAVLGGGLMGSGIATALVLSNYNVILKEANKDFLEAGIGRIKANLQGHVNKGRITQLEFDRAISLLTGVLDYGLFKDVDLVIEAVIENLSLKQQIFADLENICSRQCILASNTSTLKLDLISEKSKFHDRIVGAHFFSPAHVMPLLEIIRSDRTSPQVVMDLLGLAKNIRKTAIVVGSCTGFAVGRMFFPYSQCAHLLVDHGLDLYHIDEAMTKFGMPMGPFRLADLVGFGVSVAVGSSYYGSFPDRCYKSNIVKILLEDKRAGESTRKGFYLYDDKRKATPDPEINKYIEKSRKITGLKSDPELLKLTDKDIAELLLLPCVNEACRILDERIADKASDLDVASVLGFGFPSYRGGLIFWADSLGSSYVYSRLEKWSKTYGPFFKPCPFLAERAAESLPLSAAPQGSGGNSRL